MEARFYRGNNSYYTSYTFCRTTISIRKSRGWRGWCPC